MRFFLHEAIHIALSLLVGFAAYKIFFPQNQVSTIFSLLAFAFLAGVLVDLDHLFDYFLAFGLSFNLKYFVKGYNFLKSEKIYTPLHGFEYITVLLSLTLIFKGETLKSIFFTITLALFFHLIADIFLNNLPPKSYSLIFRVIHHFTLKDLVYPEHYQQDLLRKKDLGF